MKYPAFIVLLCRLSAAIINIPEDYPTIQSGIDASADGDTVIVYPGTYMENINFNGRNITLGSLYVTTRYPGYIAQTIIDGNGQTVVQIINGETCVLNGLTIYNGSDFHTGGGINIINSNPILKNLRIHGCSSWNGGAGIYCENASPVIDRCFLYNNGAERTSGIHSENSFPLITNCTFVWNYTYMGSIIGSFSGSHVTVTNCILWDNFIFPFGSDAFDVFTVTYTNESNFSWEGDGNFTSDPLFVDPESNNYNLLPESPCIDAGHPDLDGDGITWENDPDDQDPDGTRMDIGAFYPDPLGCSYMNFFPGDVNGDNSGDILDIVLVVAFIFGNEVFTVEQICAFDFIEDGVLDVLDIVAFITPLLFNR